MKRLAVRATMTCLVGCCVLASCSATDDAGLGIPFCTTGGAMKAATVDGRPLIWQNLDYGKDKRPIVRKVEGTGGKNHAIEILRYTGSASNAVNSKGLAYVVNSLGELGGYGDVKAFRNKLEQEFDAIADVEAYLKARGKQDFGANHLVMEKSGRIVDFEIGSTDYWAYDPENTTRQKQSFFQSPQLFVTRSNSPFKSKSHQEPDGEVDTWGANHAVRYRKARDLFIQKITNSDRITFEELIGISRHGNPGYDTHSISNASTVWGNIVLGVKSGEAAKYTTMLVALGQPDYSIYVPVWVALSQSELSDRLKTWDSKNIGWWAFKLLDDRFDGTADYDNYIRGVFDDVENNIIDAVKAARNNWLVKGNTSRFHSEARLLHNWSSWAAFRTIKSAYDTAGGGGRSCNLPPKISSLNPSKDSLTVTFHCDASDPDGDGIAEYQWNFGDGHSTGVTLDATKTHVYDHAGTYLAACYVEDGRSSPAANAKFEYITVSEKIPDAGTADASGDLGVPDAAAPDIGGSTDAGDAGAAVDAGALDSVGVADAGDVGAAADAGADAAIHSRVDARADHGTRRQTGRGALTGGCGISGKTPLGSKEALLLLLLALWVCMRRMRREANA